MRAASRRVIFSLLEDARGAARHGHRRAGHRPCSIRAGARSAPTILDWRDYEPRAAGPLRCAHVRRPARQPPDQLRDVRGGARAVAGAGAIAATVSVGKPAQSFGQFVEAPRQRTLGVVGAHIGGGRAAADGHPLGVAGAAVRPRRRLGAPRAWLSARCCLRRLCGAARGFFLGAAYDEMRDALAGRSYVADYVQTLTHELKSPLSAIRGASELLQEPMAEADRVALRRQHHARGAAHPGTGGPDDGAGRHRVALARWTRCCSGGVAPAAGGGRSQCPHRRRGRAASMVRGAGPAAGASEAAVEGDPFLLRRAVANLVDNAVVGLSPRRRSLVEALARGPALAWSEIPSFATRGRAFRRMRRARSSRSSIRWSGR